MQSIKSRKSRNKNVIKLREVRRNCEAFVRDFGKTSGGILGQRLRVRETRELVVRR